MKALLITLLGVVLLTNPAGKAAINTLPEPKPLEDIAFKALTIQKKVEQLDSLLSAPR